mgnify:CR=1 FL=1
MINIPWTEKYRPSNFESIIMENNNHTFFLNIIKTGNFPNLLFYGPPGTGKTTTILNIINEYNKLYNIENNSMIIHLNASDDRGIDIIRNNIYNFVNSERLLYNIPKFIILDEIDYMTKTAQLALKTIINNYYENVYYCIICNYISKIEISLQNIFCKIRFNNTVKKDILNYINNIKQKENINLSKLQINKIINYYNNDIRSIVNFIQFRNNEFHIFDDNFLDKLYNINFKFNEKYFTNKIFFLENHFNIQSKNIIKKYIYYFITKKMKVYNIELINDFEFLIHDINENIETIILYTYYKIREN